MINNGEEFLQKVSEKNSLQNVNLTQSLPSFYKVYNKDEKITTSFDLPYDKEVLNKTYLDKKLKAFGKILMDLNGNVAFTKKIPIGLRENTDGLLTKHLKTQSKHPFNFL